MKCTKDQIIPGCSPQNSALALCFLASISCQYDLLANPAGGSVAQGAATINSSGSQLTIQTSDRAAINWQSFNIGKGETTTFVQPSANSVVWNHINDASPSQILGNLNANGYVVLQNQSGFYIGGQATINTHGLIMTTAPIPVPDLASGSAWQFNAPPPLASIINYGQINVFGGGSAFLIANDIENHGTISAPGGKIGLYAGQQVLVSTSPDGRGLSAAVTLPQGSVDNQGKLIADAGAIAAQAKVVNQGGLIQANSVQTVNGTIELIAGDSLNLNASSVISAQGDSLGVSSGGSITIKSDHTFSDQAGSTINIAGGTQGGLGGQVEISAPQMAAPYSRISGQAKNGYAGGKLLIDPTDIILDGAYVNFLNSQILGGLSMIELQADNNIELTSFWSLASLTAPGILNLIAGNSIIFDDGMSLSAGNNWNVNLTAGTALASGSLPTDGNAGIYLSSNSYLQTQNGNINAWAANNVIIQDGTPDPSTGLISSSGAIRTLAGGSINVTAQYGDVSTGNNINGYIFGLRTAPYYRVNAANLGGISTAAGGDVNITAGGNVSSYLPTQYEYNIGSRFCGGTGAFGPQAGNVNIAAGGNVAGNYVLANGVGTITAGGNVGVPFADTDNKGFALSLIKGGWSVNAPNGNIHLQDVLNPNGVFNDNNRFSGFHLFDFDSQASLSLNAGNMIEITGGGVPLIPESESSKPVPSRIPVLLPPSLKISSGAGGLVLDTDVIIFPSPDANLYITTKNGGNFESYQNPNVPQDVNTYRLQMSDSSSRQWLDEISFGIADHAASPPAMNNSEPVQIDISGSIKNLNLYTIKATEITVGGDLYNVGFVGQNLHPGDTTSITVAGKISFSPIYTLTGLSDTIVGADPLNPGAWDSIFSLLVDNDLVAQPIDPSHIGNLKILVSDANHLKVFTGATPNPGFVYSSATKQLGFTYQMTSLARSALSGKLQIIKTDLFGNPLVQLGQASLGQDSTKYYFVTSTVNFVPASVIETLYQNSLSSVKDAFATSPGMQIGGPGHFNIKASSLDLGASSGILSWGKGNGAVTLGGVNYDSLAGLTDSGASITVELEGDLGMLTSTIASVDGRKTAASPDAGKVTVKSLHGKIDLGLADLPFDPPNSGNLAFGIYTSGYSDVEVTAYGDINVQSARIATFNGGNIYVKSDYGDVNAGTGVNQVLLVPFVGLSGQIQNPRPYGSGIMAMSPSSDYQTPGSSGLPGNIDIWTPRGDIISTLGGISQFALNGSIEGGPTVTLIAGTKAGQDSAGNPTPAIPGNIDLGQGGVVGGTVKLTAEGDIKGLIVSRQNSTINAAQNINVTVLSGGTASVNAGGSLSGTLVSVGGISASGGDVSASMISGSVSVGGGTAQSTLGTAAASTASQSAASSESQKQFASTDNTDEEQINAKKKKPVLERIKRVTVILPKAT